MRFFERYERFGWDYPEYRSASDEEIDWILRHARETGGPVLELACGTGTLLGPVSEAGFGVCGLDLSPRMLALAAERIERLPSEARARVELIRGDMTRLDLGRRFGLVLIADNSFREAEGALGAVLEGVRRHLADGGRLILAESRFDASRYPGGVREHDWTEPVVDPSTRASVSRRVTVRYDAAADRIDGSMVYRVESVDEATREETFTWSNPVMRSDDYRALLEGAGFEVRLGSGYQDGRHDDEDPVLNVVATVGSALTYPSGS